MWGPARQLLRPSGQDALPPAWPLSAAARVTPICNRTDLKAVHSEHSAQGSHWRRGGEGRRVKAANLLYRPHAVAADQVDYWDVVEYQPQGSTTQPSSAAGVRLGLVQQVAAQAVQLSPLIEEDEGVWVPEAEDAEAPEQQERVPLDRVLRIVESVYGQRQDKEHNPHGEHAHDVWQVLVPLSPGVFRGPDPSSG